MTAKYPAQVELAAEALQFLTVHADGLSIATLAELLEIDEYDTRQVLAAYHESQFLEDDFESPASPLLLADADPRGDDPTAAAAWDGMSREDWFDEHQANDLQSAVWVALHRDLGSKDTFGLWLDVPQIVDLLNCAEHLLQQEPDNEALRTAMATLQVTWVPAMTLASQTFRPSPELPAIRQALVQRRRLQFHYSREWEPGARVRTVDPYELKQTRLGYELDAGPVGDNGSIRTFLVRNMSQAIVLDETFEDPPNKRQLIERNRRTITVKVSIPSAVPPTYEALAVEVVEAPLRRGETRSDSERVLHVKLQQPFDERLAMLLLRAGPQARVCEDIAIMNRTDSDHYAGAAARRAQALLEHHGLTDETPDP